MTMTSSAFFITFSLVKLGHQGFPALMRFLSRQHLASETPLSEKETRS